MSGVHIIGTLLREAPEMAALVPVANIKAGKLPDNVVLPALLVRSVSLTERHTLKRGTLTRTVERVSITVRAATYRDPDAILLLARSICAGRTGEIAGFLNVSIITAGTGPDLLGPADSFEKAQDFRVSFDAMT